MSTLTETPIITEDTALAALMERMGPTSNEDDGEEDDASADDDNDEDVDAIEPDEDDAEPNDDEDPDSEEEEAATAATAVTDETPVTVQINGEDKTFTVAELKDFATGQEAFATKTKEFETASNQTAVVLQTAIEIVTQDLAPYKDVDWLQLQNAMPADEFAWHRENFKAAEAKYQKLVGSAQGFEKVIADRKVTASAEQVQDAVKVLKRDIEGWSDELYNDILTFGVSAGLDQQEVAQITNPAVIKLLNDARLYRAGKTVVAKKIKAAPAKVLKTSNRENTPAAAKAQKALDRVKAGTATEDDALKALMARL